MLQPSLAVPLIAFLPDWARVVITVAVVEIGRAHV